jgi:hypothetical protein
MLARVWGQQPELVYLLRAHNNTVEEIGVYFSDSS